MIADLEAERDQIDEAILVLERLSSEAKARRRRTPQLAKGTSGDEPAAETGGNAED